MARGEARHSERMHLRGEMENKRGSFFSGVCSISLPPSHVVGSCQIQAQGRTSGGPSSGKQAGANESARAKNMGAYVGIRFQKQKTLVQTNDVFFWSRVMGFQ